MKKIYFAGGCFWGTEHFFKRIRGVTSTTVGYANGQTLNPTYKEVCTDTTGYAETVQVVYDGTELSLERLLKAYFMTIDPVSVNQQGHDKGTQYRTGIYYIDEHDIPTIKAAMQAVAAQYHKPLAVEVEPLRSFYPAEEYHQHYLDKNPTGYCHLRPDLFTLASEINPAPKAP